MPNELTSSRPARRRILAVFNPAAGGNRRARFDRVVAALRARECTVTVVETTAPGHAEQIARDASPDSYDVIAPAGGDGTIREVVNGLKGKNLVVGIIPLGTANVLADEIGLGRATQTVAETLATGPIREIRVGLVNDRRFIMMAGIGFDANVVNSVSLPLKKRIGPLAYVWGAIEQAAHYHFDDYDVVIDGVTYAATSIVACNGRRYGGPFIVSSTASLSEDQFHVVLMKGRGWLSVLRYGIWLTLGRLARLSDVELVKGRDVTVRGVAGEPVQADGDIIATLPLRIAIDPDPIRLVYPT